MRVITWGAKISAAKTRHGQARSKNKTSLYNIWCSMNQRCNDKGSRFYSHYGGRGIIVCARWKRFENFYADMGDRPDGLSLDRINNNGNYEPSNCRWATRKQQSQNTRRNVLLTFNGQTMIVSEWAKVLRINTKALYHRVERKWAIERIFSQPFRKSPTVKNKQENA